MACQAICKVSSNVRLMIWRSLVGTRYSWTTARLKNIYGISNSSTFHQLVIPTQKGFNSPPCFQYGNCKYHKKQFVRVCVCEYALSACMCVCVRARAYVCVHMHACVCTCMHVCVCVQDGIFLKTDVRIRSITNKFLCFKGGTTYPLQAQHSDPHVHSQITYYHRQKHIRAAPATGKLI